MYLIYLYCTCTVRLYSVFTCGVKCTSTTTGTREWFQCTPVVVLKIEILTLQKFTRTLF